MRKSRIFLSGALFVGCAMLLGNSCGGQKDCYRSFQFTMPFSISPMQDTFFIGDTIWIESEIPAVLLDEITSEYINVSNLDIKIYSGITQMDVYPADLKADLHFDYINQMGSFQFSGQTVIKAKLNYVFMENGSKKFKVGLVPNQAGLYQLSYYNLTEDLYDIYLVSEDCFEEVKLNYVMNNGAENNYELLLNSPNQIASQEDFRSVAGYAFQVIPR